MHIRSNVRPLHRELSFVWRREYPREGDERLSGKDRGQAEGGKRRMHSGKPINPERKSRKRAVDLGRALRSVYDDTLRESVPDEFIDLLGKLS